MWVLRCFVVARHLHHSQCIDLSDFVGSVFLFCSNDVWLINFSAIWCDDSKVTMDKKQLSGTLEAAVMNREICAMIEEC